jgi:hypothetical protein
MSNTLLSQIRSIITVDVDSMDPDVAKRHTSQHESFCDMTSNQAIVFNESTRAENAALINDAIAYVDKQPNTDRSPTATVQDVVDVVVRICLTPPSKAARQLTWATFRRCCLLSRYTFIYAERFTHRRPRPWRTMSKRLSTMHPNLYPSSKHMASPSISTSNTYRTHSHLAHG